MKATVNFNDFSDSFTGGYEDNFTYEGKRALFEYLEELEDSQGEEMELDPIAFCCEYSEWKSASEAAGEYFDFEGMTYGEDGGELKTADQVEAEALEYLQDNTQVIVFDGGIIIAGF